MDAYGVTVSEVREAAVISQGTPPDDTAADAVAAARAHAASLSPNGATRKALEAVADALEALIV